MFWVLRRRRQRIAGIENEADHLIDRLGIEAYAMAKRMARDANDLSIMQYWLAVQRAIGRKTDMRFASHHWPRLVIYERPLDIGHDLEPVIVSIPT